jgi:hypothetical protein
MDKGRDGGSNRRDKLENQNYHNTNEYDVRKDERKRRERRET